MDHTSENGLNKLLHKKWAWAWILVLGFLLMNLIFLSGAFRRSHTVAPDSAGQLGDFVGGYVGTFFSLGAIVLLYYTLDDQRRASDDQRSAGNEQRLSNERQSFETKYFELVKMHRDNIAELRLGRDCGRKIFVLLIRELRCILPIVRTVAEQHEITLSNEEVMHVAYAALFFGTGPNSSRMFKLHLTRFEQTFIASLEARLNDDERKKSVRDDRRLGYTPFEGHQSRLGHYYRHLYQLMRYVDSQQLAIDKKEHARTVRAQLSTHEQALLLINSRTPMGKDWWGRSDGREAIDRVDLIVRYKMVHNLPRDFFDPKTEIDVASLFERGYFEWEEWDRPDRPN